MYRHEVARCMSLVGQAMGLCEFAIADEAIRARVCEMLGEVSEIMLRPASESQDEDVKSYWRKKKRKQREDEEKSSETCPGNVPDTSETKSRKPVVVEEEVAEEVVVAEAEDDVDRAFHLFNEICTSNAKLRTGANRSKKKASPIKTWLKARRKESDEEEVFARLRHVIEYKWAEKCRRGEGHQYVRPTTLVGQWDDWESEANSRPPPNSGLSPRNQRAFAAAESWAAKMERKHEERR